MINKITECIFEFYNIIIETKHSLIIQQNLTICTKKNKVQNFGANLDFVKL